MTLNTATNKFLTEAAAWANAATDPNAGLVSGGIGSMYLRNGNGASTPTEIYLNLFGTTTGWVKQNLVNLNIYNVKNFGAVGDGVTDDTQAIWDLIVLVNAAGGGTIYFPPGTFRVQKRITSIASFEMTNMHNIVFLGDGYSSKLVLNGDGTNKDWYMFYTHNGTSNIRWENMYMDGANVTNPASAEQTHIIFPACEPTDTLGGSNHMDVTWCYFGTIDGDALRPLGSAVGGAVTEIGWSYNAHDMPSARSCVSMQRKCSRFRVQFNWFTGPDDQQIDFEPTGTQADIGPTDMVIVGNLMDHQSKNAVAVTLSGITNQAPSLRNVFAFNTIRNGGNVDALSPTNLEIVGNIIDMTSNTASPDPILGSRNCSAQYLNISGNLILATGNTVARQGLAINATTGTDDSRQNVVADNIVQGFGSAGGGATLIFQGSGDVVVNGNIIEHVNASAGQSSAVLFACVNRAIANVVCTGNLIFASNASLLTAVRFTATLGQNIGSVSANQNMSISSTNCVSFTVQSTELFLGYRACNSNNAISCSGQMIVPPPTGVGETIEGGAAPTAAIMAINSTTPDGAVASPKGSLCTNPGGGNATVLFLKDAATSSADKSGWVGIGPAELEFSAQDAGTATAARFLAPGMALAAAGVGEIKLAVPRAGTLRRINFVGTAGTGGTTVTYTVRKNGVDTALALTINNTATTGSATGSIAVAAGDQISVSVTKATAPTAGQTFSTLTIELG